MKRVFFIVLLILLQVFFLSNCGKKDNNSESEIKKIENNNFVSKLSDNIKLEDIIGTDFVFSGDFNGAYDYYDKKIIQFDNLDLKMIYQVRKAYIVLMEGEILNQQKEYFQKGKEILDNIDNKNKLIYGEYFRVYGFAYELVRDYKNAIEMYKKSLSLFDEKLENEMIITALGGLGHTYMLIGNPYEAQKYLMMGYGLDKDNLYINRLLFRNLGTLGIKNESVKIGEKLVNEIYPKLKIYNEFDLLEIYYGLSNLYFQEGNIKKSLELSQKCLQKNKEFSLCYVANSRAYFYGLGKDGVLFAEFGVKKALEYNSNNSDALELLAYIEEFKGNIEIALNIHINNYKNIIDLDSNLFDSDKIINKQKTLIHISRLYSKKNDIKKSYDYLLILKNEKISIGILNILKQEIAKENTDFENLMKEKDLQVFINEL